MIQVLDDALGFVRTHPGMFFADAKPNGLTCAHCLVAEVMALGAEEVTVRHSDDWWFVSSKTDWFGHMAVEELFSRLLPLPEVGQNVSRTEIVIAAFAECVVTTDGAGQRKVVTGPTPAEDVWRHMEPHGRRTLGFRLR